MFYSVPIFHSQVLDNQMHNKNFNFNSFMDIMDLSNKPWMIPVPLYIHNEFVNVFIFIRDQRIGRAVS
jgi:hypothetical protein